MATLQGVLRCNKPAILLALSWMLVSGCQRREESPRPSGRLTGHNLLLITLDTTRADRLGCYGYGPAATPALDALASRGTVFEHAFAPVPLTLPTHCSIMTGRYPREHGVRLNGREALGAAHPTLAEAFRNHDYRTRAFVASFVLDARFGLARGFDVYEDDVEPTSVESSPFGWEQRADVVTDRVLAWLNTLSGAPFFAWVHYFDPHDPYAPPAEYEAEHRDPYDGEIAFMDGQIRRLTDWLDSTGLTGRTLVVVAGDHGEAFGEHGERGHGLFLYNTTLHVPLIFVHPDAVEIGGRVSAIVEMVDIYPTVMELFGWASPAGLRSRSLAVALAGGELQEVAAYAESDYARHAFGWAQQRSLITHRWKYVLSTKPQLFDRLADEAEDFNVIDEHPDVAVGLLETLQARYQTMKPGQAAVVEWDDKARRAITGLGYVSDGGPGSDEFFVEGLADPKDRLGALDKFDFALQILNGAAPERFALALPLLERIAAESPRSLIFQYMLGTTYFKAGRLEHAVGALRDALKVDADHASSYAAMGEALAGLGRIEEAAQNFRNALDREDFRADTHAKYADVLSALGRTEEAQEHYRSALTLYPDQPRVHQRLGMLLALKDDLPRAIHHFQASLAGEPDDPQVHYNLGAAYFQTQQHSRAIQHFREAVRRRPKYGRAWLSLGMALVTIGNVAEAKDAFQMAKDIPESAAAALYQLGTLSPESEGDEKWE